MLLRRGAPSSTVDDALQTAVERALRRREPFDNLQGWTNWTIKVAWHEVQAEWRRQSRAATGDPPERPEHDPAAEVEHRLELAAALEALSRLRPTDRAAVLAGLDQASELAHAPLSPSEKMRRSRARRKLAASLDQWDRPVQG